MNTKSQINKDWEGGYDYCELNLSAIKIEISAVVGGYDANVKFGNLIKPIKGCKTLEIAKQEAINYALQILHHDVAVLNSKSQKIARSPMEEIKGFVVALEENISVEDAELIRELLMKIKGVVGVDMLEANNSADIIVETRVKSQLLAEIINLLT